MLKRFPDMASLVKAKLLLHHEAERLAKVSVTVSCVYTVQGRVRSFCTSMRGNQCEVIVHCVQCSHP